MDWVGFLISSKNFDYSIDKEGEWKQIIDREDEDGITLEANKSKKKLLRVTESEEK